MSSLTDTDSETWPPAPTVTVDTGGQRPPPSWLATVPPEVLLFAVFAAAAGLAGYWLAFAGPKLWWQAVLPYTGESIGNYLFCLAPLLPTFWKPSPAVQRHRAVLGVSGILVMMSLLGAGSFAFQMRAHVNQFHDPYMTVSPWQPLWTVALPLAWAVVLTVCSAVRTRKTRPPAA